MASVSTKKKAGRPLDKSRGPAIRRLDIWLAIEAVASVHRQTHGKRESILSTAKWIIQRGGISSIIAGNSDTIVEMMKSDRGRRQLHATRQSRKISRDGKFSLFDNPKGKVFVKDRPRHAEALRVRYQEGKRLITEDENLRIEYENRLADLLERPRPHKVERRRLMAR